VSMALNGSDILCMVFVVWATWRVWTWAHE
jgi:hypothetical protein